MSSAKPSHELCELISYNALFVSHLEIDLYENVLRVCLDMAIDRYADRGL